MTNHLRATVTHVQPADTTSQGKRASIPPVEGCEALVSAQVAISEAVTFLERHRSYLRNVSRVCQTMEHEMSERISHLASTTLPEVRQAAGRLDLYAQARNRRTA